MIMLKLIRKTFINNYSQQESISSECSGFIKYKNYYYYLNSFPEPEDLLQRSYFQYLCQQFKKPLYTKFTLNLLCVPLLVIIYLIGKIKKNPVCIGKKFSALSIMEVSPSRVPSTLKNKHRNIKEIKFDRNLYLSPKAEAIFRQLVFRYWYEPYFITKCLMKLQIYAFSIETYKPDIIISSCEYSFTSSVLTALCRACNIQHINIMHGEKLLNFQDAFAEFDQFYVWDDHYKSIFTKLRGGTLDYIVELPNSNFIPKNNKTLKYDFTYYMGWEGCVEDLYKIRSSLRLLASQNYRVCVRIHPNLGKELTFINSNIYYEIFKEFDNEDANLVPLDSSLAGTRNPVSLFSTVLFEAVSLGICPVIDDCSDANLYNTLQALDYIICKKKHLKLSSFIAPVRGS
jgi:hypothetical protein